MGKTYKVDPGAMRMGFHISQVCGMNINHKGLYTMFYASDGREVNEVWHKPLRENSSTEPHESKRAKKRHKGNDSLF